MVVKFFRYDPVTGKCTPVANVDDMQYLRFERSYVGIGTWDIKLKMTSKYTSRVRQANMISLGPRRAGLITSRVCVDNDEFFGVTYSGVELKGLAAKRIVLPPSGSAYQTYSGASPEYVMHQLLLAQLLEPDNVNRKIWGSMNPYTQGLESIKYEGRFGQLAEDIVAIGEANQVGWYADIDRRAIKWGLYRGVDRRVSSAVASTLLLSASRDNVGAREFSEEFGVPTTAIVAGQGEGTARTVVTVNDSVYGLLRNEIFVDARDVELTADLTQRGIDKIAEEGDAEVYSFGLQNSAIKAYFDGGFDIGDQCTVRDLDFLPGIDLDGRLSSVEEIFEDDLQRAEATVGYDKRKLAAAIRKIRKSTQPLLTI